MKSSQNNFNEKRENVKIAISPTGELWVTDLDRDLLIFCQELQQDFKTPIASNLHKQTSHLNKCRSKVIPATRTNVFELATPILWYIHDSFLQDSSLGDSESSGFSLLDLKIELSRRILQHCNFCENRCQINRLKNEKGFCGVGKDAYLYEHFMHCGEEAKINPSYEFWLYGCSMHCRHCQKFQCLSIDRQRNSKLSSKIWKTPTLKEANSLTWIGGNPDQSIYPILKVLNLAPEDFSLPIVWNSNLYGSLNLYKLLDGLVDFYVPDFKYGNNNCALKWSGVKNYWETATQGLLAISSQEVEIFVRILVLPGHFSCCHQPVLEWLAKNLGRRIKVKIMAQYYPEYQICPQDGEMNRRPSQDEIQRVENLARELKLCVI